MRGFVKFLLWMFGILGAVCLILYLTLYEPWKVPNNYPKQAVSIEPSLGAGDLLVVARHGSPDRGDLVRCADPSDPKRFVIGRVMGRGGEVIDMTNEVVTIDNYRMPSPHACDPQERIYINPDTGEENTLICSLEDLGGSTYEALRAKERPSSDRNLKVETGKFFLVSDNRHIHDDSRDYGQVDPATCKQIRFRLWSKGGWGDSKKRFTFLCDASSRDTGVSVSGGEAFLFVASGVALVWLGRRRRRSS